MKKTAREVYDGGKPIAENSTPEEWNERMKLWFKACTEESKGKTTIDWILNKKK